MTYVPHTDEDRAKMLKAIGVDSVDDLFASLPDSVRLRAPLDLPPPVGEADLLRGMAARAGRNRADLVSFLGAGHYDHFIPPAVDALANRAEFYTAYTPYQPEISQGILQAFFEYQSMICEITGLEVSNASMYDGASALAEALVLCANAKKKRKRIVLSEGVHPEYRRVVRTYFRHLDVEVVEVPLRDGLCDPARLADQARGASGVAVQSPNVLGFIEDAASLIEPVHQAGGLFVSVVDPVSLGVLEAPGVQGADFAVGDGQPLGCPVSFGGPHFGFLAGRKAFVRKLPGRIVGATVDEENRRGFVLTFQTREQHIRREKATSNICTNQGLMALRAAVYLALLGPEGFSEVASESARKAHRLAEALKALPGFSLLHDAPFFREFPVSCPVPARRVVDRLVQAGYLAGVPLDALGAGPEEGLLVAVTENRTEAEIDGFVEALTKAFP